MYKIDAFKFNIFKNDNINSDLICKKMLEYINDLKRRSQNGEKNAQIILLFKLKFDFYCEEQSDKLCRQWENNSIIIKGLSLCLAPDEQPYSVSKHIGSDPYVGLRKKGFNIFKSFSSAEPNKIETIYAWYMLGICYSYGIGTQKHIEEGQKWYIKAANYNNELANYTLSTRYSDNKKIKYLEEAAKQYSSRANHELGGYYYMCKNYLKAYQHLTNVWELQPTDLSSLRLIMMKLNIKWNIDNHRFWSDVKYVITKSKTVFDHKSTVTIDLKFSQQVHILMLISKFRKYSKFTYISLFHKNIALSTIIQLADLWLSDQYLDQV